MIKLTRYIVTNKKQTNFLQFLLGIPHNIEDAELFGEYERAVYFLNDSKKDFPEGTFDSIAEVEITYDIKNIKFLE